MIYEQLLLSPHPAQVLPQEGFGEV